MICRFSVSFEENLEIGENEDTRQETIRLNIYRIAWKKIFPIVIFLLHFIDYYYIFICDLF
jgi:hypothetical protein